MADVDSTVEDSLAVTPGVLVLKVAHHGAASSTGTGFLRRARPVFALLSVGARNRFGHPAPELLERLTAARVQVRRTDLEGALWFEWSDDGVREVDWRRRRPPGPRRERPPCAAVRAPRQP
jgi:beta-lactamase superfamily II metal-dependent hydrolase